METEKKIKNLAQAIRYCSSSKDCKNCPQEFQCNGTSGSMYMMKLIADGLDWLIKDREELLKATKAMHTWIFLNSGDEQAAYDECGLSDEMNARLGYGGQFMMEPPKKEE